MCGICGKLTFSDKEHITLAEMTAMRDTLRRRGPDDAGMHIEGNVALGHRRLSIIDVEGSQQPLSNEDGSVWIAFNGEIYNYLELRKELLDLGHRFETRGDTEVIVHLYEQYGERCVDKLRGMFAFAIWDDNHQQLFLARDRLGKKPLHYYCDQDVFLFGSEIKAILSNPYYARRQTMDLEAFYHYLAFLYVPAPLTMFGGIKKVLPAHWVKVHQDGKLETKRYWNVAFDSSLLGASEKEICSQLLDLLKESVRIRLMADVPLGAFLSGGMDSSTVIAVMSQVTQAPIKTFSIGFSVKKYNEADDARAVARRFGTDHTEMILEPVDLVGELNDIMAYFDEPFADSSLMPTYLVSKLAAQRVKVVLSGDGGDELFGGYPWWQKRPWYQLRLIGLNKSMRSAISLLASILPGGTRGSHFLKNLSNTYEQYLLEAKAVFDTHHARSICSAETLDALGSLDLFGLNAPYLSNSGGQSWSDRIMEYDLKTYIPNDILIKVDRMSMYNSLEARTPFLDHKLVEFAAQIPAWFKFKNNTSKYILKKTMEGLLPSDILYKPKQGFSVPLEDWLRSELKDQMLETLLDRKHDGLFDMGNIQRMIREFVGGRDDHKHRLWVLFTFCSWHRAHFS